MIDKKIGVYQTILHIILLFFPFQIYANGFDLWKTMSIDNAVNSFLNESKRAQDNLNYHYNASDIYGLTSKILGEKVLFHANHSTLEYDLRNEISHMRAGSNLAIGLESNTNKHAMSLVIYKDSTDSVTAIFADPQGSLDSGLQNILNSVSSNIIDLKPAVQNSKNDPGNSSCGAYSVELMVSIVNSLNSGKLTEAELKDELLKLNWNARYIRAKHYKISSGHDPSWPITQSSPPVPTSDTQTQSSPPAPTSDTQTQSSPPSPTSDTQTPPSPPSPTSNTQTPNSWKDDKEKIKKRFSDLSIINKKTKESLEEREKDISKALSNANEGDKTAIEALQKQKELLLIEAALYKEATKKIAEQLIIATIMKSAQITHAAPMIRVNNQRLNNLVGSASGENDSNTEFGLWGEGFAEIAKQEKNDSSNAFEAYGKGFAFGCDIGNDRYIAGISYSYSGSSMTFNKSNELFNNTSSHIAILYGSYFMTPKAQILTQLGFGFSDSTLQTEEIKTGTLKLGSLEGKYFYPISENHNLIPKLGLEFFGSDYKDKKDNENKGNINTSMNIISFGIGANTHIISKDLFIYPEIYLGGEYLISGDSEKISSNSQTIAANKEKNNKLSFAANFTVNIIKSSSFKTSLNINYRKKTDFYSIGGNIKLSVSL